MDYSQFVTISIGPLLLFEVVCGYTCDVAGGRRYCENGCCSVGNSRYCCLTTYMILGIVVGCLAAVCCIASIIFCIVKQKKRNGQVLVQPTRVMVISAQSISTTEPLGYASVKPLPPGYTSHYHPPYLSEQPPPYRASEPPPPYS